MEMPRFQRLGLTLSKLREIVANHEKKRYALVLASSVPESTPTSGDVGIVAGTASLTVGDSAETPAAVVEMTPSSISEESNEPADYLIRANQGHSIPLSSESLQLTPLLPQDLPIAVHGTFYPSYEAILASGYLSRMTRNHIHFATAESGVVSGIRHNAEVLMFVDIRRAVEEGGLKFWMSANGVVLTEGDAEGKLGLEYVTKIVDRKGQLGVLWQDGEVVTELPAGLRGRKIQVAKRGRGQMRGRGRGRGRGGGVSSGGEERVFDAGDP